MIPKKTWLGALALVTGGGLAAALPALPAVGQYSPPSTPIILRSTAPIVARGAAAKPSAYVACPAGQEAFLQIALTERSGKGIASGAGQQDFPCSGQIETVIVPVPATTRPFVAGKAFAQATLFYCDQGGCFQPTKNRTITLQQKAKPKSTIVKSAAVKSAVVQTRTK
jgi:hypothetical protein